MQSSRINYPQECEQTINQTIQLHYSANHTYDLLAAWCSNEEISMPGFCKFFHLCGLRIRKITEKLIDWQTLRGGKFTISEIKPLISSNDLWQQGIEKLVKVALDVEKKLEHQWRHLYSVASSKNDFTTSKWIENQMLLPQLYMIKMMVNHANGLYISSSVYAYDRITMMKLVKKMHGYQKMNRNNRYENDNYNINNSYSTKSSSKYQNYSSAIQAFCSGMLN